MALLKKVNPNWYPQNHEDLQVGETVEIQDYRRLVETGAARLVDEKGNELPLPGVTLSCPICNHRSTSLNDFTAHVETHKVSYVPEETPPTVEPEITDEEVPVSDENTRGAANPEESAPAKPQPKTAADLLAERDAKEKSEEDIQAEIDAKRLAALEKARVAKAEKDKKVA